jgi:hypothetical protein
MNQNKKIKKLPKYEDIPLIPSFLAKCVCETPYTGMEWSRGMRDQDMIARVEEKRQAMSKKDIKAFEDYADTWCRGAYATRSEWMVKIALSKTNRGRDQLHAFMSHWLSAWLMKRPCDINIPV